MVCILRNQKDIQYTENNDRNERRRKKHSALHHHLTEENPFTSSESSVVYSVKHK